MISVFVFFQQMTAFEMRISDWSSDVCSSDLDRDQPAGPHAVHKALLRPRPVRPQDRRGGQGQPGDPRLTSADVLERERHVGVRPEEGEGEDAQTGRASCRESVSQYE